MKGSTKGSTKGTTEWGSKKEGSIKGLKKEGSMKGRVNKQLIDLVTSGHLCTFIFPAANFPLSLPLCTKLFISNKISFLPLFISNQTFKHQTWRVCRLSFHWWIQVLWLFWMWHHRGIGHYTVTNDVRLIAFRGGGCQQDWICEMSILHPKKQDANIFIEFRAKSLPLSREARCR